MPIMLYHSKQSTQIDASVMNGRKCYSLKKDLWPLITGSSKYFAGITHLEIS